MSIAQASAAPADEALKVGTIAVGRMKAGPERELLHRYVERSEALSRSLGFGSPLVVELEESRARSADGRKREEAGAIAARVSSGHRLVLLDERGDSVSSADFADMLAKARDGAVPGMVFAIGGPDGFDAALRSAHRSIGFGRATFPHQFVRVMLAEQIYRAFTILAGHPYHRD